MKSLRAADLKLLQADKEGGWVLAPTAVYKEKADTAVTSNFQVTNMKPFKVKAVAGKLCEEAGLQKLASSKPSTSPKAAAPEGDTRADDTTSRDNVEEAQVGKSDNPQEEAPIKDWSSWADDSSLSLPATKDSTSLTDTESLSGASQVASTTSDDTRQSTSSSENAPPPNTPSGADPKHSKPTGVKHTSGQVAAGRGHRSHAGESPNWKAATEPPNTPQDQQPLSPISRMLKQSRDPSLRNPLNQIIGVLGQD
ncbi:hypothetical protein MTO96_024346 [Rhipicephalus appendiculatus]